MKCKFCGAEYDSTMQFCSSCGASLVKKAVVNRFNNGNQVSITENNKYSVNDVQEPNNNESLKTEIYEGTNKNRKIDFKKIKKFCFVFLGLLIAIKLINGFSVYNEVIARNMAITEAYQTGTIPLFNYLNPMSCFFSSLIGISHYYLGFLGATFSNLLSFILYALVIGITIITYLEKRSKK